MDGTPHTPPADPAPSLLRRELRGMRWVWSLGGLSWRELIRRVIREVREDEVVGRAAQLSFYFFLSLFPLLIFSSAILGSILGSDKALYAKLLEYLSDVMPSAAYQVVRNGLADITSRSGAGNITFSLVIALWSGSTGMVNVIQGLNAAYSVREFRPWWKRRLLAIALTVVLLILSFAALGLVLAGGRLEHWIMRRIGPTTALTVLSVAGQWCAAIVFMLIVFALIYVAAPNLKEQRWQAVMPGSLVALVCWAVTSLGFKIYLMFFNSYSRTYGALGAIIVLQLWLYMTGIAILLGGEVNSEIRNAAAAAGAPEAQRTQEAR
jgi:membrane protein